MITWNYKAGKDCLADMSIDVNVDFALLYYISLDEFLNWGEREKLSVNDTKLVCFVKFIYQSIELD